jgi:hypothetical protein
MKKETLMPPETRASITLVKELSLPKSLDPAHLLSMTSPALKIFLLLSCVELKISLLLLVIT